MDKEDVVKCGFLAVPAFGLFRFKNKIWNKKYFVLYRRSRCGIQRLEMMDSAPTSVLSKTSSNSTSSSTTAASKCDSPSSSPEPICNSNLSSLNTKKIIPLNKCFKVTQVQQKNKSFVFQIHTKESVHLFAADNDDDLLDWLNSLQYVAFGEHSIVDPNNLFSIADSSLSHSNYLSLSNSKLKSVDSTRAPSKQPNEQISIELSTKSKSTANPVEQENQLYCSVDQPDTFRVTIAPTDAAIRCRLRVLLSASKSNAVTIANQQSESNSGLLSSISSNQSNQSKTNETAQEVDCNSSTATNRLLLTPCTYLLQFDSISISVCEDLRPHSQPPSVGSRLFVWPFRHIRRYGCTPEAFSLEAGRKCDSGAGMFCFHSSSAQIIFRKLAFCVNALRQEEQLNGNRSSVSLPTSSINASTSVAGTSMSPLNGDTNCGSVKMQVKSIHSLIDNRSLSPNQSALMINAANCNNVNTSNCLSSSSGCSSNGSSTPSSGSPSPFVAPELPARCRPNETTTNRSIDLGSSSSSTSLPSTSSNAIAKQTVAVKSTNEINSSSLSNNTNNKNKHSRVQTIHSLPPDLLNQLPTQSHSNQLEHNTNTFQLNQQPNNHQHQLSSTFSSSSSSSSSSTSTSNHIESNANESNVKSKSKANVQNISGALRRQLNQSMSHLGNEPLYYQKHSIHIPLSAHSNQSECEINNNNRTLAGSNNDSDDCMYDSVADDLNDPIFQSRQDLFGESKSRSNHFAHEEENAYEIAESGYSELHFNSKTSADFSANQNVQVLACNQIVSNASGLDKVDSDLLTTLLSKASIDSNLKEQLPPETFRNLSSVIRSVLETRSTTIKVEGKQSAEPMKTTGSGYPNSLNPFCGPQCTAAVAAQAENHNQPSQFDNLYEPIDIRPAEVLPKKVEPEHYVHNECEYARVIKRNVVIEHL